ncbi:hypothetical protein [Arhodomonas sp. AD133]|uniref:hypothetical protein n=1 Tax=Arhodomonas sp. AD133 TaxID=3415009 RepID=UPI003EC0788E
MNLYRAFQHLIPTERLVSGKVTAHHADGTSTLALPAGGHLRATGTDVAVGERAYVQGGRILGPAPNLTVYEVTV